MELEPCLPAFIRLRLGKARVPRLLGGGGRSGRFGCAYVGCHPLIVEPIAPLSRRRRWSYSGTFVPGAGWWSENPDDSLHRDNAAFPGKNRRVSDKTRRQHLLAFHSDGWPY